MARDRLVQMGLQGGIQDGLLAKQSAQDIEKDRQQNACKEKNPKLAFSKRHIRTRIKEAIYLPN
jgi:hypothetical protein